MEHGKRAESDVAKLCGNLFLKDFVLESPKFRTPGGQLREVADALLPHGDTLIAMQVKTRVIQSGSNGVGARHETKSLIMARQLRLEYEGAFYHVTARGNERRKIYFLEYDYQNFREYLGTAQDKRL